MSRKFFDYKYQIHRTKKTGIIFLIVIILVIGGFIVFYKSKSNTTKLDNLSYKVVLGMNSFEDKNCDNAYRLNYDRKTCGTICIQSIEHDNNYLDDLQKEMEENGFKFKGRKTKKINNDDYLLLETNSQIPKISYYVSNYNNRTYSVEYIDQSSYLTKTNEKKCNENFNRFINSLKLR